MTPFLLLFVHIFALTLVISTAMFLLRKFSGLGRQPLSDHICSPVFSLFTALYAFFLGFSLVTLWSAFLNAQINVSQEANALLVGYYLSRDIPDSEDLGRNLELYVQNVLEEEWTLMENGQMSEAADKHLNEAWKKLLEFRKKGQVDSNLFNNLSDNLKEATKQRSLRRILVKGELYPPMWVMIVFGFMAVIFGLFFLHLEKSTVRLIFEFMVIFTLLAFIFFIVDLSTPFSGYINVAPEAWQRINEKISALSRLKM